MTDLCWECQKNNTLLYRSANLSDEEKQVRCKRQEEHLLHVKLERSLYRDQVTKAKQALKDVKHLSKNEPCSKDVGVHYSFDFAQQIHFPSDPLQPGPMYFLTPRKCGIFGVCCEGIPQQVNYLIDEGMSISKGSNAVISYLHHFFDNYGLGERDVSLHCDNCSGQNKNKFMLWYLLWRTMHGLHNSINLNFMIVGHTKFAPDWCFGLLKQAYRHTPVSSLQNIVKMVESSTVNKVNVAQLVGDEEQHVSVEQFDWHNFLQPYFKAFRGIKQYQHFRFSSTEKGVVFAKNKPDEVEVKFQLLMNEGLFPPRDMPPPLVPGGLDARRKWYLYDTIREFCSETEMDKSCPLPTVARPGRDGH